MKNKTFYAAILMAALSINILHAQYIVVIGEVENVKEGTTFYLMESTGTGGTAFFNKDENNGKLINGRFLLKQKCRRADSRHFSLHSDMEHTQRSINLEFWANQGDTVYVKGNGPLMGTWEVKSKAPEQKELDAIRKTSVKELAAHQQSFLDYEAYRWYRRDTEMTEAEWDSTGVILRQKDTLRTTTQIAWFKKELEAMKDLPITDFWMDHIGTIIYSAHFHRSEFEDIMREIYIKNADKIDRKPDGKAIREWVYPYPKAELGKLYTGGDLFDVNGKEYRLADFRGEYVLLDFWAQYCGGCIEAFPQLGKLQKQYADKLTIISISVDKYQTWKTSPAQKDITWHSLSDGGGHDGGIAKSFDVTSTPNYILIAPDGTFKARLTSSDIYNGRLEKYLNGEL